jgi:hypothetical protein
VADLSIFIHKNTYLLIKLDPYRIGVRRLSSIFIVKCAKGERETARACALFGQEIDVNDRAYKIIFGINASSWLCVEQAVAPTLGITVRCGLPEWHGGKGSRGCIQACF